MKGFSVLDITGGIAPDTGGGEWDIKLIPLDDIVPAKNNNYRICDIEALADSIQADGLLSPLNVRFMEDSGKYELMSGERRYTALKHLRDKGIAGYDTAPCKVELNISDIAAEIKLIRANSTTRILSDQEKVRQAARLAELFDQLKGKGEKPKGRKREFVADALGISTAQAGRMESIERNLIPEAKEEFQQGGLNFSTAYETSLLPPEQQADVVENLKTGAKVDIKTVKERRRPSAAPPASAPVTLPAAGKKSAPAPKPPPVMVHNLKTWPEPFDAIAAGLKPWEYRRNDRDYKAGDVLHLMRYDPVEGKFTGQTLDMVVTYIMTGGEFGIPDGYTIMSIKEAGVIEYETA